MRVYCFSPDSSQLARQIHAFRAARDQERLLETPGLHLSTITQDIAKTTWPEKYDKEEIPTWASAAYQEIGCVYEDLIAMVLTARYPKTWQKPSPKRWRGIWCSPDGWDAATRTLHEMKATWASERDFLTLSETGRIIEASVKWQVYLMQVLAYMKVWGTRRALIHVWFINGNWRPPMPMLPRSYIVKASQLDVDQQWERILLHAKDRGWLK